jgi:hypothetical protein
MNGLVGLFIFILMVAIPSAIIVTKMMKQKLKYKKDKNTLFIIFTVAAIINTVILLLNLSHYSFIRAGVNMLVTIVLIVNIYHTKNWKIGEYYPGIPQSTKKSKKQ